MIDATKLTVIAPSRWIAEQAESSAFLRNKSRIEIIPNGIDMGVFAPHLRSEARTALGLPVDGIYILCGADQTQEKRKGFDSLARILSEATLDRRFSGASARVLWVGDPPGNPAYDGLSFISLGKLRDEKQMALAFAASDIFALPSFEDNLPNMLLEALSCGTPVVAYSVGGIPEVLFDRINGRLIPLANEQEFAEALLCMIDDEQSRTEMGQCAATLARGAYSASLQATRHTTLYRDLLQQGKFNEALRGLPLQPLPDASNSETNSAVGSLQKSLIIYCLKEEIGTLQRRVQTGDQIRLEQDIVIEHQQKHLDARHDVIQGLQDHMYRAEQTVAAKLGIKEIPDNQFSAHLEQVDGSKHYAKRADAISTAVLDVINNLKKELADRLQVIHGLHDHWQRAEQTCVARLEVIEKLEAHRQQVAVPRMTPAPTLSHQPRHSMAAIKKFIRFDNWWYSKMPPILAVAYLCILQGKFTPAELAGLLPSMLFSIACVAAYGHIINDIFDIDSDRRAGKRNAIARLAVLQRWLICVALGAGGFLPALYSVHYSGAGYLILAANYLWPTIYSLPSIRLKERGMAGVLCDAVGSHVTPTLFVLVVLSNALTTVPINFMTFAAIALVWSIVLGIKGILHHQVADRENDRVAGTVTLATNAAPGRIELFLPRYNLLVELPISIAFVSIVSGFCPLAVVGLSIYCLTEVFKFFFGFQFALNGDPRNTRPSIPFVNESFYDFWLPIVTTLQLALLGLAWIWLPLLQFGLFGRSSRRQIRDLAVLTKASCGQIGTWYAQIRLKRQSCKGSVDEP